MSTDLLTSATTLEVGILLFPDVEVLDFAGPFEVFSVAARIIRPADRPDPVFRVSTVARLRETVRARHGLQVVPDHHFENAPAFDLLIVPGGVMTQPMGDARTLDYVRASSARARVTASVCTGSFLLAKAGLVTGRSVTTHWEDIADLRAAYPHLDVREDVPFVDQGNIVTSAGISAGIGMSLHLVGRSLGMAAAQRTARQMQYDWP